MLAARRSFRCSGVDLDGMLMASPAVAGEDLFCGLIRTCIALLVAEATIAEFFSGCYFFFFYFLSGLATRSPHHTVALLGD